VVTVCQQLQQMYQHTIVSVYFICHHMYFIIFINDITCVKKLMIKFSLIININYYYIIIVSN